MSKGNSPRTRHAVPHPSNPRPRPGYSSRCIGPGGKPFSTGGKPFSKGGARAAACRHRQRAWRDCIDREVSAPWTRSSVWAPTTPCGTRPFGRVFPAHLLNGEPRGLLPSTPAAIAWDGRIDVFGLGTDYAVFHKEWNGTAWSATWERLGGIFTSEVSAVSWGPGQLDIFARGSDFTLRHMAFDGTKWLTEWENFGDSLASQPIAVSWGPNRLDIFAVRNEGFLDSQVVGWDALE